MQLTFDYTAPVNLVHSKENNSESQALLEANRGRLNNQCLTVLQALQRGERLTTGSALLKYGIGDLRRRVKDLLDKGYPISKETQENRFKIFYMTSEQIKISKEL